MLLHIRKSRFIFAPATHPKALHVLSKTFRPPRSGLVPFLELVRARIRNTRGIENGISLNRDTNTIEALAALHIPGPHRITRKADQPATGPKPWTLETMPHPSRYDEKGMAGIGTRITRALPACYCTKGPQYRNTDYCDRYRHRHYTSHRGKKGRKQPASGERKRL